MRGVAEELRLFLRTALYAGAIAVVYWFVSYEISGTFMLGAVAAAALVLVCVPAATVRSTVADLGSDRLRRLVAFEEHEGTAQESPLAIDEGPLPSTSGWPVIGAGACLLIGVGAVFGPWFYLPGLAIAALCLWGWLDQMR